MKKSLLALVAIVSLLSVTAHAGEVKKGAVVCISQKYLNKYYRHTAAEENDFAKDMVGRAQCVVKRKPVRASKVSEVGDNIQVEILGSFKLWLKKENFQG